jgi:two-component system sensor histidine kinase/response regulator
VVPPDIQGLNVLVVDDLADSRTIMRKMLSSLGFRVESLSSGPEALSRLKDNLLRNNPIELIMMDWKMPEMDGIEVSENHPPGDETDHAHHHDDGLRRRNSASRPKRTGINGFLTQTHLSVDAV